MKTILIDDEQLAREELRGLLAEFTDVEILGEASHVTEALTLIAATKPDLIFLDIEMPGKNGFDLLAALPSPHPRVIFVTGYDEFALRAFDVNALDYLLKPVHSGRLATALEKVRLQSSTPPGAEPPGPTPIEPSLCETDRVFVRDGDRYWLVPLRDIRLLEAESNHTRIFFGKESPLIYRSLGSLEERLPAKLFLRANRSQMINLSCIDAVSPWFSGTIKVSLRGGNEVELSRRQAQVFRQHLSL